MRTWLLLWLAGCGFAKEGTPDGGADLSQPPSTGQSTVFTTRLSWAGSLEGTPGLLAADFLCNRAAEAGGFGDRTFRAWLSDGATDAIDRVLGSGPWVRRDGHTAFARRPDELPMVPLNIDENGLLLDPNSLVWTGTGPTGRNGGASCNGWFSADAGDLGVAGFADSQQASWSDVSSQTCDQPAHLYCFESP
jgi:hypothetical protein